jgi:hypothetical protein
MERVCGGYTVTAGRNASGDTGVGDSHHFVGDIAFDSTNHGFEVFSDCDGVAPCDSPDRIASDNTFENCAAIGVTSGFRLDGVQNSLDHVTSIGMATDTDIWLGVYSVAGGPAATSYVTAALCVAGGTGISSANQTDWSIASSNVWLATSSYVPNDAHIATSTTVDPELGGCRIYLPPNSPMLGAGPNGTPIGADIRTLQDGRPYWRSDGTFAGCGAVVPGVNDDPATSCIGVHTRLNVGVNGCALPR